MKQKMDERARFINHVVDVLWLDKGILYGIFLQLFIPKIFKRKPKNFICMQPVTTGKVYLITFLI